MFATGRRTVSAARTSDPERDAISCVVYHDQRVYDEALDYRETMTAGTCSRIVYLPWRAGRTCNDFTSLVSSTLDMFREEEKQAGGAAIDYE